MQSFNGPCPAPQTSPVRLTKRETEIMTLIREGQTSKQIADGLFISKRTVDFHLEGVYGKFNVVNRMQALQCAIRLGIMPA